MAEVLTRSLCPPQAAEVQHPACSAPRAVSTAAQSPETTAPPPPKSNPPACRHHAVFLSDLHLGAFGARAERVLRFLQSNPARHYVLVGDILDLWHPMRPAWCAAEQRVIDHLYARHAAGAQITYVRGNHDPAPESAPPHCRLPVPASATAVHHGADGRRYLVIHGDAEDPRVLRSLLLRRIGARLDDALRRIDLRLRSRRGIANPRRSLIERVIHGFNAMVCTGRGHERRLVAQARTAGLDGVICGHFHIPALHQDHGLTYANCGDWVDNLTAIVEDFSGNFLMLRCEEARMPLRGNVTAGPIWMVGA